jgi:hypothetical protein
VRHGHFVNSIVICIRAAVQVSGQAFLQSPAETVSAEPVVFSRKRFCNSGIGPLNLLTLNSRIRY